MRCTYAPPVFRRRRTSALAVFQLIVGSPNIGLHTDISAAMFEERPQGRVRHTKPVVKSFRQICRTVGLYVIGKGLLLLQLHKTYDHVLFRPTPGSSLPRRCCTSQRALAFGTADLQLWTESI